MKEDQKAIALNYDTNSDNAPKILTKGKGCLAEKIIEIAKLNDIPIYEDHILAEILDKINIECEIPEYLFEVVAEIYSYTFKLMQEKENILS